MKQSYLLGIDAGATKTAYVLYDAGAGKCCRLIGGCGNHEGMSGGYDEFARVMKEHIGKLCAHVGIQPNDIDSAGLGIAGVDTRRQHEIISGIFSGIGLKNFGLANDAVLGIKAESRNGTGICAVNGTGFSVYGIDKQGRTCQIGGLGDVTGDKGGGGYFAVKALEAVYRYCEKEGPETLMTQRLFALLGIREASQLTEAVSAQLEGTNEREFARNLSILLHQAAADGDLLAGRVLTDAGAEYAASVLGVLRHLPSLCEQKTLTIVLVGSCFVRSASPLVKETMMDILRQRMPTLRFDVKAIQTEPAAGALLWAAEKLPGRQKELGREQLLASFSRAEEAAWTE